MRRTPTIHRVIACVCATAVVLFVCVLLLGHGLGPGGVPAPATEVVGDDQGLAPAPALGSDHFGAMPSFAAGFNPKKVRISIGSVDQELPGAPEEPGSLDATLRIRVNGVDAAFPGDLMVVEVARRKDANLFRQYLTVQRPDVVVIKVPSGVYLNVFSIGPSARGVVLELCSRIDPLVGGAVRELPVLFDAPESYSCELSTVDAVTSAPILNSRVAVVPCREVEEGVWGILGRVSFADADLFGLPLPWLNALHGGHFQLNGVPPPSAMLVSAPGFTPVYTGCVETGAGESNPVALQRLASLKLELLGVGPFQVQAVYELPLKANAPGCVSGLRVALNVTVTEHATTLAVPAGVVIAGEVVDGKGGTAPFDGIVIEPMASRFLQLRLTLPEAFHASPAGSNR